MGEPIPADALIRKAYVPDAVKVATDETRRVTFAISTGAVDRDGDTIAVDGWDVAAYLKNPVVLWAHRSDMLPIAKALSVTKTAGQLKATAEFPPAGLHPLADTVFEMLKTGYLRATSVGFRPIKSAHNEERGGFWPTDFVEQELVEFSVVPVPSNPEALMESAKEFTGALMAGIDLVPLEQAIALARSVMPKAAGGIIPAQPGGTQVRIGDGTEHIEPDPKAIATAITRALRENTAKAPALEVKLDVAGVQEAVAKAVERIEKAGRTFSKANAQRIKDAHGACDKAIGHLKELVDQIGEEPADEPEEEGKAAPPAATAAPAYACSPDDLAASIRAAVAAAANAATRGKE